MRPVLIGVAWIALTACGNDVVFKNPGEGGAGGSEASVAGSGGSASSSSGGGSSSNGGAAPGSSVSGSTGGGLAGASVSTVGSSGVGGGFSSGASVTVTSGSMASVSSGGGFCKSCEGALLGDPGPLCPASEPLFAALIGCVCDNFCVSECAGECGMGPTTPGCDMCVSSECTTELDNCLEDI